MTTTSGVDLDPDGYAVKLIPTIAGATYVVPTSGTLDISLPAGTYVVTLDDLAPNCGISAQGWWGTAIQIQLPRSSTRQAPAAQVSFVVNCQAIPGAQLADGSQLAFVRDGQIWVVSSDGSDPVQLTTGPGDDDPAWSLDGKRIAFSRPVGLDEWNQQRTAIHLMDADGSNVVQLTEGPYDRDPTWAPDGRRLAFASRCRVGEGFDGCVLIASTDFGDATRTRVGWPQGWHAWPAWSPDGTRIAFSSDWAAFDFVADLYVATLADARITQLTSGFRFWDEGPIPRYEQAAWSPDGRQLAVIGCPTTYFTCDTSNLMVMNADGSGQRMLTSPRAAAPTWSPDGRTIAFAVGGGSPTTPSAIQWIKVDGSARGTIVADGSNPAWRPSPPRE